MAPATPKTKKNIWVRFDRENYEIDEWESLCRAMNVDPSTKSFIGEVDRTTIHEDEYSSDGELLTTNWPEVSRFLTGNVRADVSSLTAAGGPAPEDRTFTYLIDSIIRIFKARSPQDLPRPAGTWMENVTGITEILQGPTATCSIPRIRILEKLKELKHTELAAIRSGKRGASTTMADAIGSAVNLLKRLIQLYSDPAPVKAIEAVKALKYLEVDIDIAGMADSQYIARARKVLESGDETPGTNATVIPYRIIERRTLQDVQALLPGASIEVVDAPTGAGSSYSTKIEWLGKQVSVTHVLTPIVLVKKSEKTAAAT